jgi:hypothetical protein
MAGPTDVLALVENDQRASRRTMPAAITKAIVDWAVDRQFSAVPEDQV